MTEKELNERSDALAHKIKHYLISATGKRCEQATPEEFYHAFCMGLREGIMASWTASSETVHASKQRMAYFFSMEYLPGRFTAHNVLNMGASDWVRATLKKLGRSMNDVFRAEPDPGLGNGGLGRLSSCFFDSLATLHYPARGYGLRFQYGVFEQEIWAGQQVERPDCWLLNDYPWEERRDAHAVSVNFGGKPIRGLNSHGEEVFTLDDPEEVRAMAFDMPMIGYAQNSPYSVLTLRLWSTKESPRNFQLQRFNAGLLDQAAENTSLTDVLYPNDNFEMGKRMRLKQEFLLVSASLQDILAKHLQVYGNLSQLRDKVRIQLNDAHPVLVIAELIRTLMKNHHFSWNEARDACIEICSYTNHTILREALVEWNEVRMKDLLPRQHNIIERLNLEFCNGIRKRFPGDEAKVRRLSIIEKNQVKMAHLAIVGCHAVNGVAALHSRILKERLFKEFDEIYPQKFRNVTNGVTHRRWLMQINPKLSAFITARIGAGWITDFKEIRKLGAFASDKKSQEEFLAIKKENKQTLIDFLARENPLRDAKGKVIGSEESLDPTFLFDIQIKRIHEYKRQLLNALHLILLVHEIEQNPNETRVPRVVLFGGKAAAGYAIAKQIIQLIAVIARKVENTPLLRSYLRVVFVENYNVSKAELIIPAADLSEQISTAGWEASGTGNMKLAMNGALTIGTEDGANIEMRQSITDAWWPFGFGASAEDNQKPYQPKEIYSHDEPIRRAVDALKDGSLTSIPIDGAALAALHQNLVELDPFRVLQDLRAYHTTQRKVEELFLQPLKWAETALHNIAGMGPFSTDESIRHYAEIWGIVPCPVDPAILKKIQVDYANNHSL
jgi:starch phosphorylase